MLEGKTSVINRCGKDIGKAIALALQSRDAILF